MIGQEITEDQGHDLEQLFPSVGISVLCEVNCRLAEKGSLMKEKWATPGSTHLIRFHQGRDSYTNMHGDFHRGLENNVFHNFFDQKSFIPPETS